MKKSSWTKQKQAASHQAWKLRNPESYRAVVRRSNQKNRAQRNAIIAEAKKVQCMDCLGRFPVICMDFDHREPELKNPSASMMSGIARTLGLKALAAEIEKCDVVCENCHRIRTAKRMRWEINYWWQ